MTPSSGRCQVDENGLHRPLQNAHSHYLDFRSAFHATFCSHCRLHQRILTKGGVSMQVWLTSCLFCLDLAALFVFTQFGRIQSSQTGGQKYGVTSPYGECSLAALTASNGSTPGSKEFLFTKTCYWSTHCQPSGFILKIILNRSRKRTMQLTKL